MISSLPPLIGGNKKNSLRKAEVAGSTTTRSISDYEGTMVLDQAHFLVVVGQNGSQCQCCILSYPLSFYLKRTEFFIIDP